MELLEVEHFLRLTAQQAGPCWVLSMLQQALPYSCNSSRRASMSNSVSLGRKIHGRRGEKLVWEGLGRRGLQLALEHSGKCPDESP